ncbi:MAG TPA: SAM-dependent methyltransferase [Streptosporangiaceae bacterium]|nr:SAM-dependent methyltransferase [Streptosporangiaceae bacterium]
MTVEPDWIPPGIDTTKANIARVYDYWLGGSNNFRADQDAARAMIAIEPNIRAMARANRDFLGRAVRYLVTEGGIRQFLDVGSGIPTGRNVHEVAQEAAPGSRVVYADVDEVAVAHSRLLLENNPDTVVIQADVREPEHVLTAPETQLLIDFSQPVGLLLVSVLHFLDDADDPWAVMAHLRDALAPGSFLVLSHATGEAKPDVAAAANTVYMKKVAARGDYRSRADIRRLFDGFTLVEPGLVYVSRWRPDEPADPADDGSRLWLLGGVGRLGQPD